MRLTIRFGEILMLTFLSCSHISESDLQAMTYPQFRQCCREYQQAPAGSKIKLHTLGMLFQEKVRQYFLGLDKAHIIQLLG